MFAACSCRKGPPPDLPALALDSYQPAVREQLEKAWEDARLHPAAAEKTGRLGMILQAYGQYAPAAACYRRASALAPRSFEWVYYLGTVQSSLGENFRAIETLREALRLNAEYVPAQLRLADLLLSAGKAAESAALYGATIVRQPGSAVAHYGLARAQSQLGNTAAAIEGYRKACELAPDFGAAHYALALLLQQLGRRSEAEPYFATYEAHKTGRPAQEDPLAAAVAALMEGAVVHLRRGVTLDAAGRLKDSIVETERALAIDPELIQARVNLISLYSRTGQPDRAEAHYKAGLAVNADSAELHYNFGVLAVERKRYSIAARAFEQAIKINPSYAEAHNNLGAMFELEGRSDDAVREYRQAVLIRLAFPQAHYRLARLLLARGDNRAALEHFERALSPATGETPTYLFALAAAYNRAGDRSKAISYGRQARDQAAALGQTQLAAKITSDLRMLEQAPAVR